MKFKYSAFIENTPEMREWLRSIGYCTKCVENDILFTTTRGEYAFLSNRNKGFLENDDSVLDCRSNPQLFKALTAVREDIDYMQWFVCDFENKLIPTEPMYLSDKKCFNGILIPYHKNLLLHEDGFHIGSGGFHKATLTELQEHFKLKEK